MLYRRRQVMVLIPSLRGGGAERVIVALLRHLDRTKFRLMLAVVDMREAAYQDYVPNDVELIDLGCSRVRYALPKIIRLIWQQRPEVVFSPSVISTWRLRLLGHCYRMVYDMWRGRPVWCLKLFVITGILQYGGGPIAFSMAGLTPWSASHATCAMILLGTLACYRTKLW